MKPYGREKNIKGCGNWKYDYRIRIKNRKIRNWWEGMSNFISRKIIKQNIQKNIDGESNDG